MTYTCSACGTTRTNQHKLAQHKRTQCKSAYAKPDTGFSLSREALANLKLARHNA